MKKGKKVLAATLCVLSLVTTSSGSVFAASYKAPPADGIDTVHVYQLDAFGPASTSRKYNSSEFSTGVYLNGAPFTMDSKGTAKFTSANQLALNSSERADISYQVLDNYSNKVYSGTQKVGNLTGITINASSKVQKGKEVKIYLHNNAGVKSSASGTFNW